jgi:hypothetical protein
MAAGTCRFITRNELAAPSVDDGSLIEKPHSDLIDTRADTHFNRGMAC